jgi:pyruvate dehydrogenase E2 component (dihydrolipoamide acetyltransferase)
MVDKVVMPKLTYEMEEGRILEWLCQEGESIAIGQALFVVETDKAAIEVPAEVEGTLLKVIVSVGDTVPIASLLAWIGEPDEEIPHVESPEPQGIELEEKKAGVQLQTTEKIETVVASPIAKRMAKELGIDLRDVQRSIGKKRIREADVKAFADAGGVIAQTAPEPKSQPAEYELVQPTPFQRAMASHLTQAAAIPQLSVTCDVELTRVKSIKDELSQSWEDVHPFPLTLTPMLATLVSRIFEKNPLLNASWMDDGIYLYEDVNLGIAMASERGLVVPVVRKANRLSLSEIATEIARLRVAADTNRLQPADLEGGTFTLTNMGMLGITNIVPVINPPQSGILGIGASEKRLTPHKGNLEPIEFISVTLVADHRLVDGALAAAFLGQFRDLVDNPKQVLSSSVET